MVKPDASRTDGRWIRIDDLINQRAGIVCTKRQTASQQLKKHDAQRIEVRLLVERVILDLLWRHVRWRSNPHDEGRILVVILVQIKRQAKIGNLGIAILIDQDIGRFDVAVHNALPECMIQRQTAFKDDFYGAMHRQELIDSAKTLDI